MTEAVIGQSAETLNVRETAALVGVHENTIRNWADRGLIRAYRLPGSGFRRFSREEVDRLIEGISRGEYLPRHDPQPFELK